LYAYKQATINLAGGPLLIRGRFWTRGSTVVNGAGAVVTGTGGEVLVHNDTSLNNGVTLIASASATCHGTMKGSGTTLIYSFGTATLDLSAGALLVDGNFWMRGTNNTTNRTTLITGAGPLVAAGAVDIDNATRITGGPIIVGNYQVELTDYVSAEDETILYSPYWTDLDGYATLVGAMISPEDCDIDVNNRVRGYIYAGDYADIQGSVEWTLPDGSPAGGQILCKRLLALNSTTVRFEEKPIARQIPGLSL
jgi:hypothetical protein